MLTLDNLSFSYGEMPIVSAVNTSFNGGIVALLGTNGAGKTTLLHLMAGLLTPDSGSVRWCGDLVGLSSVAWRRSVGYLPQSPGLYPQMTTHEFLDYMLVLSQWKSKKDRHIRIEEIADDLNIHSFLRTRISSLSGGMRQRVAIAQAFIHQPSVVFLDEPTNNLDHEERERFHRFIAKKTNADAAPLVFYIGHVIPELLSVASDIVFLRNGSVIFHGTSQEFIAATQQNGSPSLTFEQAYRAFVGNIHP